MKAAKTKNERKREMKKEHLEVIKQRLSGHGHQVHEFNVRNSGAGLLWQEQGSPYTWIETYTEENPDLSIAVYVDVAYGTVVAFEDDVYQGIVYKCLVTKKGRIIVDRDYYGTPKCIYS